MKEEVIEKIELKKEKPKIPKEISNEITKKVYYTVLKAIGIILYFMILNLAYNSIKQERLMEDLKIFAGAYLVIGIVMMERAYKKDSFKTAISSIELIFLSFHTLSIMHIITFFKYDFRFYLLTSSYIISIYYILKSVVIYTKERKEYLKSLSDISEIVKKDEPIKKEAKKRNENIKRKSKVTSKDKNNGTSNKEEKTKSNLATKTTKRKASTTSKNAETKKSTTSKNAETKKSTTSKNAETKKSTVSKKAPTKTTTKTKKTKPEENKQEKQKTTKTRKTKTKED